MPKFLKYLRRTLAAVVGGLILLYFLDFMNLMPREMHALLHIQLVPALLGGSLLILGVIFLLTLLFGRVYCSVVCPLGIMQDFILRLKIWYLAARKRRKKYRTRYARPLNYLRYGVFAVTGVLFIAGISYPLLLLDPYSNFGRMAVGLFRPVVLTVNNWLADLLSARGNYTLYNVPIENTTWLVAGFAAVLLVVLAILVWRRERIWCNTMCPVGTLLGFFSRFSLFRIRLASDCNNCKLCESNCKSRCIDAENRTVDASRCVTCFNCLGRCKRGAISYQPTGWSYNPKPKARPVEAFTICGGASGNVSRVSASGKSDASPEAELAPRQVARRRFIKGSLLTLGALATAKMFGKALAQEEHAYGLPADGGEPGELRVPTRYPLPPGAVSLERFRDKCTACQLCISKCPTQVLQPAFLENGLTGMMQPYMRFKPESFCNYDCQECFTVCPNHALLPLTLEEKKLTRVGVVHFVKTECIVYSKHQDCGACAEHCPSQAVHMVPFEGTLTIPALRVEYCIGCGGCESICPVVPAAIFVEGLLVQEEATPPTEDKLDDIEITDFGF